MLIYRIGEGKYKVELRSAEKIQLQQLQAQLSTEDLKILQLVFRIGLRWLTTLMK